MSFFWCRTTQLTSFKKMNKKNKVFTLKTRRCGTRKRPQVKKKFNIPKWLQKRISQHMWCIQQCVMQTAMWTIMCAIMRTLIHICVAKCMTRYWTHHVWNCTHNYAVGIPHNFPHAVCVQQKHTTQMSFPYFAHMQGLELDASCVELYEKLWGDNFT